MKIIAVLPAHNEQDGIAATIQSLYGQTHPVDRVIVVCDNCTDDTERLALENKAEAIKTVGNTAKKAGAINQALELIFSELSIEDFVLIMDADSMLASNFIETGLPYLNDRRVGGLSGAVKARPQKNICEVLQAIEYSRGTRTTSRSKGRVNVLSGAATIFPADVLFKLSYERGKSLPGKTGEIFMQDSLTEDYELTLAVRKLGYKAISTSYCQVITDVMPTWKDLAIQRMRWQRGTMESLWLYRKDKVARRGWAFQTIGYLSSTTFPLMFLAYFATFALYRGHMNFNPMWLSVYPLFVMIQLADSWNAGLKGRVLAVLLLPTFLYENYLYSVYWRALWRAIRGGEKIWLT